MKRSEKYPDTSTFHYFNANPKNRMTTDCVIRAISTATKIPYNQVIMDMAKVQVETGYDGHSNQGIDALLKRYGWIKHKQPRKEDNTKYTGVEFCERARTYENYIANIGGHHIVAIVEGKVWDIWNSTHKCIGNYWTKG